MTAAHQENPKAQLFDENEDDEKPLLPSPPDGRHRGDTNAASES